MINIDTIYSDLKDLSQKNFGGYITPSEFSRVAILANDQYFRKFYGSPEEYRYDKPTARIAYPATKLISDKLNRFIVTEPFPGPLSSVDKPDDLIHTVSIDHTYAPDGASAPKIVAVKRVELDRWRSYTNSVIDTPTKEFPIYKSEGNAFIFSPTLDDVTIMYLRMPKAPKWGYTVSGGRPVYNSATSQDFEWDEEDRGPLLFIMASLIGMSLEDPGLVNYSENKMKQ